MFYFPNYAGALRCIRQDLESRNVEVFELIADADEFVVQCATPIRHISVFLNYAIPLLRLQFSIVKVRPSVSELDPSFAFRSESRNVYRNPV